MLLFILILDIVVCLSWFRNFGIFRSSPSQPLWAFPMRGIPHDFLWYSLWKHLQNMIYSVHRVMTSYGCKLFSLYTSLHQRYAFHPVLNTLYRPKELHFCCLQGLKSTDLDTQYSEPNNIVGTAITLQNVIFASPYGPSFSTFLTFCCRLFDIRLS